MTEWVEFLDESHFIKDLAPPIGFSYSMHTSILRELAQQDQLDRAMKDEDRRSFRTASGRMPPLIIVVDDSGAVLRDGHHRLANAILSEREWMPVTFQRSDKIRVKKVPIGQFLGELLVRGLLRPILE